MLLPGEHAIASVFSDMLAATQTQLLPSLLSEKHSLCLFSYGAVVLFLPLPLSIIYNWLSLIYIYIYIFIIFFNMYKSDCVNHTDHTQRSEYAHMGFSTHKQMETHAHSHKSSTMALYFCTGHIYDTDISLYISFDFLI